jgi:5-dehydro-2-deoxygluconokinase
VEICALAFDHRQQLEKLAVDSGVPPTRIPAFKRLVAEALRRLPPQPSTGAIIDARYGRDSLDLLTGRGLWLARPVERPGSFPLEFEEDPDPALSLRSWPAEHVVKCLITVDANDPGTAVQEQQLLRLERACRAGGHELLLEVIPRLNGGSLAREVRQAIQRIYEIGMRPSWWKLPPLPDIAEWRKIGAEVRRHDEHCRGIVILGLDSSDADLQRCFAAAADEPLVSGFAVGRAIFWRAAEEWFAGRIDDEAAVTRIKERFEQICSLWRNAREAAIATTAALSVSPL